MMLLSLIVLILAIFNSRYEYESYIRMIKICEPSIMDVIGGSVNKCNLSIIFSILIILNVMYIISYKDIDVFVLKYKSVANYKKTMLMKLTLFCIYISIIYFVATYTYIVNTDLKLINWDKINSYYCYYNHTQSNVGGYIALLFMYLYLLINLLLITHIYYILYLLTKKKVMSMLIFIMGKTILFNIFHLSVVPQYIPRQYTGHTYIIYMLRYIIFFFLLVMIIYLVDFRKIRKE